MERHRASRKPRPNFEPEPLQMMLVLPDSAQPQDTRPSWSRPSDTAASEHKHGPSKTAGRPSRSVRIEAASGTVIDLAEEDDDTTAEGVYVIDLD